MGRAGGATYSSVPHAGDDPFESVFIRVLPFSSASSSGCQCLNRRLELDTFAQTGDFSAKAIFKS